MASDQPLPFVWRHDAWGSPMWRRWLGPWVLVAGRWFRLALDSSSPTPYGQRRWVFGPTQQFDGSTEATK